MNMAFRRRRVPLRRPLPGDPAGGHVPQAPRLPGGGGVPAQGRHLAALRANGEGAAEVGHVPAALRHARARAHPEGQGRDGEGAGAV